MLNYKIYSCYLLILAIIALTCNNAVASKLVSPPRHKQLKNIVLIAGTKSHDPGEHEYVKTVKLIKVMLDRSNVKGIKTRFYLNGWPPADSLLNKADLILFVTDGADGINFKDSPFLTTDRMAVLQQQVDRGCGIALLHFSTFADYENGQKLLEWAGGYYDWQDSTGDKRHYSDLKVANAQVTLASPKHPISNGVKSFNIKDEFYYNMRFMAERTYIIPVLNVPSLGGSEPLGNVVAWAYKRKKGGRAFCATMAHYYSNWHNENFRKVLLNGLIWAAGIKVPTNGMSSVFYTDEEVAKFLHTAD
ncbi:ThuA domain-containing protein [uncultured Mucilaginibacter sp.]|uniref:ThuA domain-containing protein n=1 Tax=uncultured Mucilaginibacter sp. TaxID=797541 RepID=UPI0025CC3EBA|nr:ThuA domain-containing protein [uncultured Mucilaginibacter sp.]